MKQSWLITSFEPFAGRPENNSQTVMREIQKIAEEKKNDPNWKHEFHFTILPTEYDGCHESLMKVIASLEKSGIKLSGVLSLGEGAEDFKLETQANNLDDVPGFPDNKGVVRIGQKIFPKLKDEVIPMRFPFEAFSRIRTSKSPGFFVCNHLCAKMSIEFQKPNSPYYGFIHVPRTGMGGIFTAETCALVIMGGFKSV